MSQQLLQTSDTIAAIATPLGIGGIGVIRVSGNKALEIVDLIFKGKTSVTTQQPFSIQFGKIIENDEIIDEVLLSVFHAPKSFTGENVVEISCHGSPAVLKKVLHLITLNGARIAAPGEFTKRAFLNGKMDLSEAEAIGDLIHAESEAERMLAISHIKGAVSDLIKSKRQELIDLFALLELELDFAEEDVEFANREKLLEIIQNLVKDLNKLAASFEFGRAVKEGYRVVIFGEPNVGKSTLLNALLEEERAIVSEIPGTTRDAIEEVLIIGGTKFRFVDTAGLRDEFADQVEGIGIKKTYQKMQEADLLIHLFDVNDESVEKVLSEYNKLLKTGKKIIAVGNKADKPERLPAFKEKWSEITPLMISAKHQQIDALLDFMENLSKETGVTGREVMISSSRQLQAIERAKSALNKTIEALNSGVSGEIVSLELRIALNALGEITGEISNEEILGSIFSRFCIGK
jgi:tRNA modification GTPase